MTSFDSESAKEYLKKRERDQRDENEKLRLSVLEKTISVLKQEHFAEGVQVYLVGSLIREYAFTKGSDVDIVMKNYREDRFELWTRLEEKIGRGVEVIQFENCSFKSHVEKEGLRVR